MDSETPAYVGDVPDYVFPSATRELLEYTQLPFIDLSRLTSARDELTRQVYEAVTTHGFFYAINHGYSFAQTKRIFSIANLAFDGVEEAEKQQYTDATDEVGTFHGYKPRETWTIQAGVKDQIEQYSVDHIMARGGYPKALRPHVEELRAFAHHNHFNVLHPLLRLIALALGLPEDTLVNQHSYDEGGDATLRFMKYFPRSASEEVKTANVWLKGHTDFGSLSILWSQPIGGLQVRCSDGEWRWVRHVENAIVVNTGDALQFLTGGLFKPTIHRVIQPPQDQRQCPRLGVYYFAGPDKDVKLIPYAQSEVIQKAGIHRICKDEDAPTMGAWRKSRIMAYGQTELKGSDEKGVETEVIHGIVVKHYN